LRREERERIRQICVDSDAYEELMLLFAEEQARWQTMASSELESDEFRSLAEISPAAMFVVQNNAFLYVNPALVRVTGYTRTELMEGALWRLIESEDHLRIHDALSSLQHQAAGRRFEIAFRKRGGQLGWLDLTLSPIIFKGRRLILGTGLESTERRRTEQALEENQAWMQMILDNAPIHFFVFDTKGRITLALGRNLQKIGWSSSDLIGRSLYNLGIQEMSRCVERVLMGESLFTILSLQGAFFETHYTPLFDEQGKVVGGVSVATDVSETKQIEKELRKAKESAEASSQAKSQFLANMSHELRTPLNAIIGYSEMLQEDVSQGIHEGIVKDLEKITIAGRHLLSLVNDVLDLSKIEAGRMELFMEVVRLQHIIQEVLMTVQPLAAKNKNTLTVEMKNEPTEFLCDPIKVRQILINLLSNACKFTKEGSIVLRIGEFSHQGQAWLSIAVEDTGIGIDSEKLRDLFRSFSQADSSTSRKYGGTGLGLAISRHFCRMMGGDIEVYSELGKGSCFTVFLPQTLSSEVEQEKSVLSSAILSEVIRQHEYSALGHQKVSEPSPEPSQGALGAVEQPSELPEEELQEQTQPLEVVEIPQGASSEGAKIPQGSSFGGNPPRLMAESQSERSLKKEPLPFHAAPTPPPSVSVVISASMDEVSSVEEASRQEVNTLKPRSFLDTEEWEQDRLQQSIQELAKELGFVKEEEKGEAAAVEAERPLATLRASGSHPLLNREESLPEERHAESRHKTSPPPLNLHSKMSAIPPPSFRQTQSIPRPPMASSVDADALKEESFFLSKREEKAFLAKKEEKATEFEELLPFWLEASSLPAQEKEVVKGEPFEWDESEFLSVPLREEEEKAALVFPAPQQKGEVLSAVLEPSQGSGRSVEKASGKREDLQKSPTYGVLAPVPWLQATGNNRTEQLWVQTRSEDALVLVIDDDPSVLELMSRWLSKEGYRIALASNGEEGLRLAKELQPTVITLDVLLPDTDGWACLQQLKADPKLASIPVLMISMLDNQSQGFAWGAAGYMTKPIDRVQLVRTLKTLQESAGQKKLLLLESDVELGQAICQSLQKTGWYPLWTLDANEAVRVLNRGMPDAIVFDLEASLLEPVAFVQAMRTHPLWSSLPLGAILSSSSQGWQEEIHAPTLALFHKQDTQSFLLEIQAWLATILPQGSLPEA
jgi:PAS domain S-box-containing protein